MYGAVLAGAVLLLMPPQESNIAEREESVVLWTDDGLLLELDPATGAGLRLELGGESTPFNAPLVRFEEVVESNDAANLLDDNSPEAWGMPPESAVEEVHGEPGPWLHVTGENDRRPRRTVALRQAEAQPLIFSGLCQARVKGEAFGWWNRHLALNVNGTYVGGMAIPEQSAYFGQYDHGPQFNKRVICPDRPIDTLELDLSVLGGECHAWYKELRLTPAQYRIVAPRDRLRRADYGMVQEFDLPEAALRGAVTLLPRPDAIEIRCVFESTEPRDRAVSAYVAVPLDAVGGRWFDHARSVRVVEDDRIYRDVKWYGAGRDGYNNRYPFGCVQASPEGPCLVVAVPPDEPRVFQTEYDAGRRELRVRFDLGLSPDAGTWANRGSFSAYLYTVDGQDGFRGAADRYQRMFDWAFKRRVEHGGTWLAFMTPTSIPGGPDDLHFKFVEATCNMGWEGREGMYSLQYSEPWIHHHEFPPHMPEEVVRGPVEPRRSLDLVPRIASDTSLPLFMRRQYASYPGHYVPDKWGEPQGYFFRSPEGGRNENMMITNPIDRLPPTPGALHSMWYFEQYRDGRAIRRQWYIPGWSIVRTTGKPSWNLDETQPASGRRSLRFDPVEGSSYFEQHLRGMWQTRYCDGGETGPFEFAFAARGEGMPAEGTRFRWRITAYYEDGTREDVSYPLEDLGTDWKRYAHVFTPSRPPRAIAVNLDSAGPWRVDPTTLWIDDLRLATADGEDLLRNGGFEEGELLPARLSGAYLDTMECYEANLNYRRDHWPYADEPPTFDSAREPALHQIFSHVSFARRMAEWFHREDRIVFGNCVPTTPFAAPYLDVLGTEVNWKHGGVWAPGSDTDYSFARFMAGARPYCVLQYGDFTVEEQTRYMKRCLFYGFFPSNQASPTGGWYWADPIGVDRHRAVYARWLPVIREVADTGWQALTLAATDTPDLWVERFGDGDTFYVTVFNPGPETRAGVIALDSRLAADSAAELHDLVADRPASWDDPGRSWKAELEAEDVAVFRIRRGAEEALQP